MSYTPPTDEQLVNFALVFVRRQYPAADKDAVRALLPLVRDEWLRRHREFQAQADALLEPAASDPRPDPRPHPEAA